MPGWNGIRQGVIALMVVLMTTFGMVSAPTASTDRTGDAASGDATRSPSALASDDPTGDATAGATATPTPTAEATTAAPGSSGAPATAPSVASTYFAASSPFNTLISSGAATDGRSAAMVAALAGSAGISNLVHYGIPIYHATASTPRVSVSCTAPADWGPCGLSGVAVPLSDDFHPNDGSDGAMVVVDRAAGVAYEFWRAVHGSSGWTTEFGGVSGLKGSGWAGVATASGASRLGGVILLDELKAGVIPHALALQSSMTCATGYRAPAIKTDGTSTSSSCIPEGARVQLDPALDLSTLKLSAAELPIAVALQKYGAFVMDTGGATLSVSFEKASDASGNNPGAAYAALGLKADYQAMKGIPWSKLRVLAG